jgi:sortase A
MAEGRAAKTITRVIERLFTYLGVLGLATIGIAYLDSAIGKRQAIAAFDARNVAVQAEAITEAAPNSRDNLDKHPPDQSLWSERAKTDFIAGNPYDVVPLAVLRLGRLDLEVPIFIGTDRLTLNRGAGVVKGTAIPDETGNAVISAHRDSFFRPLKDVVVGDILELQTMQGTHNYVYQSG